MIADMFFIAIIVWVLYYVFIHKTPEDMDDDEENYENYLKERLNIIQPTLYIRHNHPRDLNLYNEYSEKIDRVKCKDFFKIRGITVANKSFRDYNRKIKRRRGISDGFVFTNKNKLIKESSYDTHFCTGLCRYVDEILKDSSEKLKITIKIKSYSGYENKYTQEQLDKVLEIISKECRVSICKVIENTTTEDDLFFEWDFHSPIPEDVW